MRILRVVMPGSAWPVNRGRAVALAQAEAAKRGLPWEQPVRAYRHYGNWAVRTHVDHIGGNVHIVVDGGTGDVLRAMGPTPR